MCRICLQGARPMDPFLAPCKCAGSQRFVHQSCLRQWQWTVQFEPNSARAFRCGICGTPFSCGLLVGPRALPRKPGPETWAWPLRWNPIALGSLALLMAALAILAEAVLIASVPDVPGLRAGTLLVATDHIRSGIFRQSVVLLVEHSSYRGAQGYVVNKPLHSFERHSPMAVVKGLEEAAGGPVQLTSHGARLCHSQPRDSPAEDMVEVVKGVWHRAEELSPEEDKVYSRDEEPTYSMAAFFAEEAEQGVKPECMLLRGYAGWAPRQLEAEIARGAWQLLNATQDLVFDADRRSLWRRLVEAIGT